ncbi:hypothetical protein [Streptosporangium sp. NPDC051022]|uniref:hypothetical protein n=1 Tax=Streptosporangium sp. NPDC051022 TaxID=3155752 RepID=UPI00343E9CB0
MAGDPNDIIEAEAPRGPRRWVGIAVLAALVAVPVISLLAGRDPGVTPPSPASSPSPDSGLASPQLVPGSVASTSAAWQATNVLHPKPRRKGGREILDVVFPDGSKAEVDYPADLGLAELGVRPAMGGWLEGYFSLFRQLTVPSGGSAEVAQDRPMIRRLTAGVTLWQPMSEAEGQVLLFDFAPWYVTLRDVKNGMTYEQRLMWAENLRGRTTGDGYLVLKATSQVRLAAPGQTFRGELVGSQLWFGGDGRPLLVIAPAPHCDTASTAVSAIDPSQGFSAETCRGDVYVAASGEREVVERMMADVRIRLKS